MACPSAPQIRLHLSSTASRTGCRLEERPVLLQGHDRRRLWLHADWSLEGLGGDDDDVLVLLRPCPGLFLDHALELRSRREVQQLRELLHFDGAVGGGDDAHDERPHGLLPALGLREDLHVRGLLPEGLELGHLELLSEVHDIPQALVVLFRDLVHAEREVGGRECHEGLQEDALHHVDVRGVGEEKVQLQEGEIGVDVVGAFLQLLLEVLLQDLDGAALVTLLAIEDLLDLRWAHGARTDPLQSSRRDIGGLGTP
mmetsp:Transcript_16881/g.34438  ORF Transcript_16881/g.34438 Transcript_16881/m.34438 type:complete len:256 (+) Transcript_16881:155-922(+)